MFTTFRVVLEIFKDTWKFKENQEEILEKESDNQGSFSSEILESWPTS
jgi:hypothetical protein